MSLSKDAEITIRRGGDDAVAAVAELTAKLDAEIARLRAEVNALKVVVALQPTHVPEIRS